MSSYFDAAQRLARQSYEDLVASEEQVFKDVVMITGDREFPDDLREKILGAMACRFVWHVGDLPASEMIDRMARTMEYSAGIDEVHELFHELARRRIKTRFGILCDSPTQMRMCRDEHDEEAYGG
jgi:hypothetical protein